MLIILNFPILSPLSLLIPLSPYRSPPSFPFPLPPPTPFPISLSLNHEAFFFQKMEFYGRDEMLNNILCTDKNAICM